MGRVLAIDYGDKRLGLALSDTSRIIASPFDVVEGEPLFFAGLGDLLARQEVEAIVVGLPLNMDGSAGPKARQVLEFKERLEQFLEARRSQGRPGKVGVETWDERLTTVQAESALRAAGLSHRRRRQRVDKVAAQILLQSYLDRQGAAP